MTGRTILAYFTDEARVERLTGAAMQLAALGGEGRLLGLYAGAQFVFYPSYGEPVPPGIYEAHAEYYAQRSAQLAASFEKAVAGAACDAEWRYLPPDIVSVSERVSSIARACDLIVTDLLPPAQSDDPFYGVAEDVALGAGRPVLLLPDAPVSKLVGGRVLLAWDGSRECARAAFDALPLMKSADHVTLTCVRETADASAEASAADLAATLAHHGAACTVDSVESKDETVGAVITRRASEVGADLIVMGAYGHSRLREFVFGGATRQLFQTTRTPLLVSH